MKPQADIIIAGAGLAGLTAALACAHMDMSVILVDAVDPQTHMSAEFDGRAFAIAASAYQMYRHLGVAEILERADHVQPITDILIADGDLAIGISPLSLHFNSEDAGGGPMGYMMESRRLRQALVSRARGNAHIDFVAPFRIASMEEQPGSVVVTGEDGRSLSASVLVAADGRNSRLRRQMGIGVQTFAYNQKAIVTTVAHEQPHHGVAHELFLPPGPFAILPLTGNRSSIVWTDRPGAVDAAMALGEAAFTAELGRRFGDMYGRLAPCAPRWAYPLSLQMAEDYVAGRCALIGDAAHAIHPIAGQGLNMGLRDAAALADVLRDARGCGLDLASGLGAYALWRNADNRNLAAATDVLNRLFSNGLAPVQHARRIGLAIIDRIKPAQSFFIKEASGRLGELPSLLRA